MAWIDNRAWAHPKIADLSDKAFRVWVNGLCYSSGFVTNGRLTAGHQKLIGSTPGVRRELENAGLWIDDGPHVLIHDWDEHNGERDKRAEHRKRYMREYQAARRQSYPQAPVNPPVNVDVNVDNNVDITPLTVDGLTDKEEIQDLRSNMSQIGRKLPA